MTWYIRNVFMWMRLAPACQKEIHFCNGKKGDHNRPYFLWACSMVSISWTLTILFSLDEQKKKNTRFSRNVLSFNNLTCLFKMKRESSLQSGTLPSSISDMFFDF